MDIRKHFGTSHKCENWWKNVNLHYTRTKKKQIQHDHIDTCVSIIFIWCWPLFWILFYQNDSRDETCVIACEFTKSILTKDFRNNEQNKSIVIFPVIANPVCVYVFWHVLSVRTKIEIRPKIYCLFNKWMWQVI